MTTQIEKKKPFKDIKSLIDSGYMRKEISKLLPRTITPVRFCRVILNALIRQPKLMKCTQESFAKAMLDLASIGLEPDGRQAHLIPFDKYKFNPSTRKREFVCTECQVVPDYKGLVMLMRDSDLIADIHADVVFKGDEFDYAYGTSPYLTHKPVAERDGIPVCAYSVVKFKDGSCSFEVMTFAEIEGIRKRSKTYDKKTGKNSGPWDSDYNEMAKKTVIKRHSKVLPLGKRAIEAIERDFDSVIESGNEDPRLDLIMPESTDHNDSLHQESSGEKITDNSIEKVSEGHVKVISDLLAKAKMSDDAKIDFLAKYGCENSFSDLSLNAYGKAVDELMNVIDNQPSTEQKQSQNK